jgi:hypothetical protein
MHGCSARPHTMANEHWPWSSGCSSARVEVAKESVSLDVKRAFPCASTVGADLGKRRVAQRFPVFC